MTKTSTKGKSRKGKKGKAVMITTSVGPAANPGGLPILQRSQVPKITPITRGVRIVNTEVIGQAIASNSNTYWNTAPVNPASSNQFQWLANLAINYQQYRWNKLEFFYVPAVGTTTNGLMEMGIFYEFESAYFWYNANNTGPPSPQPPPGALANLADYTVGPVYGGGALSTHNTVAAGGTNTHFKVCADTRRMSNRFNWYIIDPSPANGGDNTNPGVIARYNTTVAAHFGTQFYTGEHGGVTGKWYVSYDIELIEPAYSAVNFTLALLQRGKLDPPFPPGDSGKVPKPDKPVPGKPPLFVEDSHDI